ncbi:hypothetical protein MLC59_12470 [Marinobacter bryozoorum]|uniref:hypothetical protein n=1 Tax=Marinobacter bryozoorum TaxID=256324 RepID=UPI002004DE2E|nr:hypothetical protein [Marinobacter bryozoorum]MCK7544976.1 hypothetical protein [Marinobacter bryozoorum]
MTNFVELTVEGQLKDLVRPRPDWFEMNAIEDGLAKIIPEFATLGIDLPHKDSLLTICAQGRIDKAVNVDKEASQGVRGLKGLFPQHAAIIELGRRDQVPEALLRLSALIIVCVSDWSRKLEPSARDAQDVVIFDRRVEGVWRQIRLISQPGLNRLPPVVGDVEEFYSRLEETLEDIDPREAEALGQDYSYLTEIARFFNFYLGGGRIYQRSRKHGDQPRKIRPVPLPQNVLDTDPDSDLDAGSSPETAVISRRRPEEVRATEHYLAGNSPDEVEDGPRLIKSARPLSTGLGGNPVQAAIRVANRKIHQRRAAQLLPGRWQTLNEAEVRSLISAILNPEVTLGASSRAILLLSLLTGRDLDAVFETSLVRDASQVPKANSIQDITAIYVVAESREWVVKALQPESRRTRKKAWKSVLADHEPLLYLPIPESFWSVLEPLVADRKRQVKKRSVKLFSNVSHERANAEITAFLSSINRGNRGRTTLARIAYHLTEELHAESGDLIEASLVTGRQPPYGASAAIYYHHCDRQKLLDQYSSVTRRWQSWVLADSASAPECQRALLDGTVGSDLVIDTPVVADLFKALREQVEYDRDLLGTLEGLRVFHNSLTNYVVLMLFWMSGYRAVQDPLSEQCEFNHRRRWLVIADKTGDGYGHCRMVPACQVLADQLVAYHSHAEWLRNRLSLIIENRQHGSFLFYLDTQLDEVQLRPASMETLLEWAYVLPLNLNRHWLRGELRRLDVSGPYVDRFMGHWSMGQEPWGRFSAVDPVDFHGVLDSALGQLAEKIGLQVVEGIAR